MITFLLFRKFITSSRCLVPLSTTIIVLFHKPSQEYILIFCLIFLSLQIVNFKCGKIKGRKISSTAPLEGQILAWESSEGNWKPTTGTGTGIAGPSAAVKAARTSALSLTSSWQDIVFDYTEIENDTSVVEDDNTNKERLYFRESGLFLVEFTGYVSGLNSGSEVEIQILLNGSTQVSGAYSKLDTGTNNTNLPISIGFIYEATANDYFKIQAKDIPVGRNLLKLNFLEI